MTQPRILIIAGSDSGGGAGIQADIKTVMATGGYAMTAITALTAQNTLGVQGIHPVPPAFLRQQIEAVLSDIGADILKTGMLHDQPTMQVVVETLQRYPELPLVLDPVMVATSGDALQAPDAIDYLKTELLPRARVVTPNIPEAALLTGMRIPDEVAMQKAGEALLAMGAKGTLQAVLMKGGHLPASNAKLVDMLIMPEKTHRFASPRIGTVHTHGTGCTLASALASYLAQGVPLPQAVEKARTYVQQAIAHAPGLGKGHGPLGHGWALSNV